MLKRVSSSSQFDCHLLSSSTYQVMVVTDHINQWFVSDRGKVMGGLPDVVTIMEKKVGAKSVQMHHF